MEKREIKKLKEYFKKREDVLMAFVFGSFAKGRQMKESDFDIAVYFKSKPENFEKEDEIWSDTNKIIRDKEVHIVCLNEAPASLISNVFGTGVPLIVRDKKLYWEVYLRASSDTEDFLKFMEDFEKIKQKAKSLSIEEKERVKARIDYLRGEFEELDRFKKLSWDDYLNSWDQRKIVERWTEGIINALIDIAKIILASEKKQMPRSYEEALINFGSLAGLDEKQSQKLASFAKLRNILAHEYLDILYGKIQDFIKKAPPLYEKISNFLDKYLKT